MRLRNAIWPGFGLRLEAQSYGKYACGRPFFTVLDLKPRLIFRGGLPWGFAIMPNYFAWSLLAKNTNGKANGPNKIPMTIQNFLLAFLFVAIIYRSAPKKIVNTIRYPMIDTPLMRGYHFLKTVGRFYRVGRSFSFLTILYNLPCLTKPCIPLLYI
jgi:hypothetical protein